MGLHSCRRATDPPGCAQGYEGLIEAEVQPVLCSLGHVLGWICSLRDVFPNLHRGLYALTAGLLRRPPEYSCKPLWFFCSDDLEILPLLGHNHFLRVYTTVHLLRSGFLFARRRDLTNEYEDWFWGTLTILKPSLLLSLPCSLDVCVGFPLSGIKAMTGRLLVCAWDMCCGTCVPPPHIEPSAPVIFKPLSRLSIQRPLPGAG